jgi:hypothetical protein
VQRRELQQEKVNERRRAPQHGDSDVEEDSSFQSVDYRAHARDQCAAGIPSLLQLEGAEPSGYAIDKAEVWPVRPFDLGMCRTAVRQKQGTMGSSAAFIAAVDRCKANGPGAI